MANLFFPRNINRVQQKYVQYTIERRPQNISMARLFPFLVSRCLVWEK